MTGEFAFGDNEIDGEKCPAVQAGCDPLTDDYLLQFVELYDTVASDRAEKDEGVISEETAQELWETTLNITDGAVKERGQNIAELLGWEV